jgi:hypothetical protein
MFWKKIISIPPPKNFLVEIMTMFISRFKVCVCVHFSQIPPSKNAYGKTSFFPHEQKRVFSTFVYFKSTPPFYQCRRRRPTSICMLAIVI